MSSEPDPRVADSLERIRVAFGGIAHSVVRQPGAEDDKAGELHFPIGVDAEGTVEFVVDRRKIDDLYKVAILTRKLRTLGSTSSAT